MSKQNKKLRSLYLTEMPDKHKNSSQSLVLWVSPISSIYSFFTDSRTLMFPRRWITHHCRGVGVYNSYQNKNSDPGFLT